MTQLVPARPVLGALALVLAAPFAAGRTAVDPAASTIVVTAARTQQSASEVLADYTLISADDITRANQHSLVDLLQAQRGIEVARNGGPGTSASVFIRGAAANQNIVLVDGVRIGSSTLGAANWSALPVAAIDHIEIIYGPLSTMYGADAIGGVVQIFTRQGGSEPRTSVLAEVGSDATRTVEAALSGTADRLRYALSAGHDRSDGFSATKPGNFSYNPDNDGYARDSATGHFVLDLGEGREAGFLFLHSHLDAQYDSGPSTYDTRAIQQLDNVALFLNARLTPSWKAHLQLTRASDKAGTDSSAAASGKSQIDSTQTGLGWQNDIGIGTDMFQWLLERRIEKVAASSTPAVARERATSSAAAAYHLKRGAHLFSVSARDDDSSQYGSNASGAIGYGYRVTPSVRTSVSAGSSFRAPTFNELYYPSFGVATNKPEHGRNVEASVNFDVAGTQLSATYFRNRITDLLVTAAVCPVDTATHPYGCAYNVDKATLSGLSLGARTQWRHVVLHAEMDWQDPRDDTTGNTLVRRAKRHANAGLEYSSGPFEIGAQWVLSGQRFDDVANKRILGGYGLLNLTCAYAFARDWSAQVRVDNATNKQYELARTYATPGIQVFAGIRYGVL